MNAVVKLEEVTILWWIVVEIIIGTQSFQNHVKRAILKGDEVLENQEEILKSKKLLQYINEFWICFNKEDKDEMLEILMRALDKVDKNIENIIKKYE